MGWDGVKICFICKGDNINITDISVLTSLLPQHYDDPEQVKSFANVLFISEYFKYLL